MDYFKGIIGQKQVVAFLRRTVSRGNLSHAYLFIGPQGVGKYTTALAFAKAILALNDEEGVLFFQDKDHPDLMIIERSEKKTLIGIEKLTGEMEPWLALRPYRAARRVVIIRDAHLLSPAASNAILKTLEEPPGYAVILLLADREDLLETIVSRCQLIRFSPLNDRDIVKLLEKEGINPEKTIQLARLAQGSVSTALDLAREDGLEENLELAQSMVKGLAKGQEIEVFKWAEKMAKKPEILVGLVAAILRDISIYQQTGQADLLLISANRNLSESIKQVRPARINAARLNIESLRKYFKSSINPLLLSVNIAYEIMDAFK